MVHKLGSAVPATGQSGAGERKLACLQSVTFVAPVLAGGIASALAVIIRELEVRGVRCSAYAGGGQCEPCASLCSGSVVVGNHRQLARLLLRERPSVVNVTALMVRDAVAIRIIDAIVGLAHIVCTSHGSCPVDVSAYRFGAYTAVSESAARAIGATADAAVTVIPNAADATVFWPGAPAEATAREARPLLWVGRSLQWDWQSKDVLGFLLCAAILEDDWRCVLVDAADAAEPLGIETWLRGRVDYRVGLSHRAMAALYREAAATGGVLLSTSRDEGMPMVLLEAWACGLPVVVPRSPGFECVQDGRNGLVYAREEGIAGVFRCLASAVLPEVRTRLIAGGLEAVRNAYDVSSVADAYCRVYASLAVGGRPKTAASAYLNLAAVFGASRARWLLGRLFL